MDAAARRILSRSLSMVMALIVIHAAIVVIGAANALTGDNSLLMAEARSMGYFDTLLEGLFALLPFALLIDQATGRGLTSPANS